MRWNKSEIGWLGSYDKSQIILALIVLVLGCLLIVIFLLNQNSNHGAEVLESEAVAKDLTLRNQVLENEVASNASLQTIEAKAKILGFVPIKKVQYLHE